MTKKTRKTLFLFFIIVFLIITPLICLYAAGYQIGKNFSIQKTGILVIKTKPAEASVFLENKTQKNLVSDLILQTEKKSYTTPSRIKNLLPGKYDIKLEKNGYWPWEKQLVIGSGQSVYIENVNLFKNNLPVLVSSQQYTDLLPSPNGKMILAIYSEGADVINLNNDTIKKIDIATSSSKIVLTKNNCSWSPSNDAVMLGSYIYSLTSGERAKNIDKLSNNNTAKIKWNLSDKDKIAFASQSSLYYSDLNSLSKKLIIKNKNIIDFLARGNNLFILYQENDAVILSVWGISENKSIRTISLPKSNYAFINSDHNLLNILDKTHNTLYLIDPLAEIKTVIEIINGVSQARWINNDKLIFANDYEIWIYNAKNYSKFLLTRISERITDTLPFVNENYLFYATERNINVMEMDERDKRNVIKLVDLETINRPYLNNNGSALYFYSKIGGGAGIYKLAIQ